MTFLNMDAMSVASNCSIIYYTPPGGGGVFFLFKLEGCALKVVGGCKPPLGGLEISLLRGISVVSGGGRVRGEDLNLSAILMYIVSMISSI